MRRVSVPTLIVLFCRIVLAQDDARQASVAAATDNAVRALLADIGAEPVTANLTVKDFLDRTHGVGALAAALRRADQIGGPRWLDERTCQVRLEASGALVAAALERIAADHPRQTPVPAAELSGLLAGMKARTFAATGSSTTAAAAPPPPADSFWNRVPPEQRRQALDAATRNAVDGALASVALVDLGDAPAAGDGRTAGEGRTVGDVLKVPAVRQSLADWLASRPVTAVDYRQSDGTALDVEVTLAASGSELADVLRAALIARNDFPRAADPAAWARVRDEMERSMAPPVGHAPPPAPLRVILPPQAPGWAGGMVDVAGYGGPSGSFLRAARAAEADALGRLREQVMDLRLVPEETVGEASRRDPDLGRAVDRAVHQGARLYKSEYHADGKVVVRMSLDLRPVWGTIENRP